MIYDENLFKEKANKKARRIWLVFALLLSANYGSDAAGHLYPMNQYVIFLILCWVPFLVGDIILKIKGKASDLYRLDLVIGYGIFYTFVLCTTASPIAFTYILPVTSLLVLYKNKRFMIGCGIANSISVMPRDHTSLFNSISPLNPSGAICHSVALFPLGRFVLGSTPYSPSFTTP